MKRLIALLVFIIILTQPMISLASKLVNASPYYGRIYVNGKNNNLNAYMINNNSYYKLRDIAQIFNDTSSCFDIAWNDKHKSIQIITGQNYNTDNEQSNISEYYSYQKKTVAPKDITIYIDGIKSILVGYNIDGNNYFKLRDLGEKLNFDVEWDEKDSTIKLYSKQKGIYRVKSSLAKSSNLNGIKNSRFAFVKGSYLIENNDKTISVVDAELDKVITIETYNSNFKLLDTKEIKKELSIFGGFYKGEDGYYFLFGQDNLEEDDKKEVYRIVKYSFDFKRISSVGINGGDSYTTIPFRAGCPRMAQNGKELIVHTSRTRYLTEDGLNHQSNITIKIDTNNMQIKEVSPPFPDNHVSHSFNQFVLFDDSLPVYVDHGDAYPRSVFLQKESKQMGADLLWIYGKTGENITGVSLGGFEISTTKYLVAGNSIIQQEDYLTNQIRNIFVATVPRTELGNYNTELIWITNHSESGDIGVYEPKLVKINDKSFVLMWQEYKISQQYWVYPSIKDGVKYVYLDEMGHQVGEIRSLDYAYLSNCDPIVIDGQIVWYTTNGETMQFYTIPIIQSHKADKTSKQADIIVDKPRGDKISAGSLYSVVVKDDGTVWAWGENEHGQLGNGTNINSNIPVQVKGLNKVVGVSAGEYSTVALKEDGTVWEWGREKGVIRNESKEDSNAPIQVKGLTKIVGISIGNRHTVALKEDGTVWSWGSNIFGELGDRTNNSSNIPVKAKGVSNMVKVSAGNSYTIALKDDGTVWAWGSNYKGQLGDGTDINRDLLVQVKGLDKIIDISSGDSHNIALREDGTVWTWGGNFFGELGDGTKNDSYIPMEIKRANKIIAISAGYNNSMALKEDGTVLNWGYSSNRTNDFDKIPMPIRGLGKIKSISAGWNFFMTLREDDTIWSLGNNYRGQFGDGTNDTPMDTKPVQALIKLRE